MKPLDGVRIIELAGLGALPFAGMMLADLGADVIRVERLETEDATLAGMLDRGRRCMRVDLKQPDGIELVLRLAAGADAMIEGFRPGVIERLGLSPDACHRVNPALVIGRLTGWGQDGPYSHRVGHDINYVSITGGLWAMGGTGEVPRPPLQVMGDFAGGGMLLALGVCAALYSARTTGVGAVVDAAMVDGVSQILGVYYAMTQLGMWNREVGSNLFDGGAPFYRCYETKDGQFVAVGAIEPKFYADLLALVELGDQVDPDDQLNEASWPQTTALLAEQFKLRTQAEWVALSAGTDACVSAVNDLSTAIEDSHLGARGVFVEVDGICQTVPAPRFGSSELTPKGVVGDQVTREVLLTSGFSDQEVTHLFSSAIAR